MGEVAEEAWEGGGVSQDARADARSRELASQCDAEELVWRGDGAGRVEVLNHVGGKVDGDDVASVLAHPGSGLAGRLSGGGAGGGLGRVGV